MFLKHTVVGEVMKAIVTADKYRVYGKKQTDFFQRISKRRSGIGDNQVTGGAYETMPLTLGSPPVIQQKSEVHQQIQYISHNAIHVKLDLALHHERDEKRQAKKQKEGQAEQSGEKEHEEMSAYDRYVQTSWLKEIYKTYRSFTDIVIQKEKEQERGGIHYPVVTLLMKKNVMPGQGQALSDRKEVTYSETDTQFHIEKKIQAAEKEGEDRENLARTIYANIDMKNIAGHVYRDIEEKLRYERLKKGL